MPRESSLQDQSALSPRRIVNYESYACHLIEPITGGQECRESKALRSRRQKPARDIAVSEALRLRGAATQLTETANSELSRLNISNTTKSPLLMSKYSIRFVPKSTPVLCYHLNWSNCTSSVILIPVRYRRNNGMYVVQFDCVSKNIIQLLMWT